MPSDFNNESRRMSKTLHGGGVMADQQEQLPCPRCESTNTKFCYYNNYNFSQPRHFCKSCRRYWTHGGTLRDIPVGGVSRKSTKRSRTCSSSAAAAAPTAIGSRNYPLQATPVLFPQSTSNGGAKGSASSFYGGFPSVLNYNAVAGNRHGPAGGFGLGLGHGSSYFDEVRFGQGITVWPFSTGVADAVTATTTTSHVAPIPSTWQFEGPESKVGFVSGGDYLA